MKTILAFGTFDILHPGHLSYLQQARRLGDRLIVVIARDTTVESLKKHKPVFNEKERLTLVGSLRIVSKTLLGNTKNHFDIVKRVRPDVICLGYDHRVAPSVLRSVFEKQNLHSIEIVRAKPYRKSQYKSSRYRRL